MTEQLSASATTLEQARVAIESGEIATARRLLLAILQVDKRNHKAWLWLSGISDSADASLEYAQRAQEIVPNDPSVTQAVEWAEQRARKQMAQPGQAARLVERSGASSSNKPNAQPTRNRPKVAISSEEIDVQPEQDDLSSWMRWLFFVVLFIALLAVIGFFVMFRGSGAALAEPPPIAAQALPALDVAGASIERGEKRRILSTEELPPIVVVWDGSRPQVEPTIQEEQVVEQVLKNSAEVIPSPTPVPKAQIDQNGLLPKESIASTDPIPMWTPTPQPTPAPTREIPQEAFVEPMPSLESLALLANSGQAQFNEYRWIDVDLTNQILTAYENGVPVLTTYISSGAPGMETVIGQFRIYVRYESQHMTGYHLGYDYSTPNVPHVQYFHGNFGLHGAYWHEDFGTAVSHGCVNMDEPDAAWLYNFAGIGTLVNVHY